MTEKRPKLTGGDVLVQCLVQEGAKKVFGVPGDQLYPFLDAIYKSDEIDFVTTRHEQAAAHAADAWARVTGNPGVCVGTVGPGAADLVPGVYVAYADSIPMIVITAQNQSWKIHPDHGSMQALDQQSLFHPITKWRVLVNHWKRIPSLVQWAYRNAVSGRPGPVLLDFPADVLFDAGYPEELESPVLPPHQYRAVASPVGNPEAIRTAAQLLVEAKAPLIHAGGGVLQSEASDEIVGLAEHLQAPVTTSLMARGVIPEDHELCLLPAGYGSLAAQVGADIVLAVGGRFGDLDFWGKPPGWGEPDEQRVIQIDIDPTMHALNRRVDLAITGDAKVTLRQLLEEVKKIHPEKKIPREDLEDDRAAQEAWLNDFKELSNSSQVPIHPLTVIQKVRDFFPRSAISIVDGGNTAIWAVYLNRIYEPRTFLWASDSGHLGTGIGYAIGAQLARPDRSVYCITSDGSVMFNIQELETAARLCVPIVIIVVNDQAYGMIKAGQKAVCDSRFIGVDFTDARYDRIAEAMGCYGERIQSPDEVTPALQRAVDSGKPALLDVVVDSDVNLEPPDFKTVAALWLEGCEMPDE
ncbi:MAG: thiamine pyrophosphate-binding protein [Theionarchaea archaeon]|nr:thiamine pyrophosphate-binding protein [Theionarchaea archaeon]MBU7037988.1 thiamine pyrophosphate-binding protein [Theionarchaea archaeon]